MVKTKQLINELSKSLRWQNFIFLFIAGCINAFGVNIFLAPVGLYDSGISGTSMLLWQITPERYTLSLFLLLLNTPLFLFGWRKQGTVFTVYSLWAVLVYSGASYLITNVLPIDVSTASPFAGKDLLLCALFGGLISGVACAIKSLNPKVKVYGVQAENAPSMKRSLEAGEAITLDSVRTFADGIAVKHPGDITLDMVRKYVDEVVTVSEDEIAAAILALMEKQKLVAEGAGAVTVAAAMFGKLPIAGKKVCCLISGGNIDVNILSRVITRGLQREGRNCLLTIALDDKPGQLLGVTQVISECGANIVGVTHERSDAAYAVTSCLLRISMETRDFAQIEEIKAKLKEQGFKLVE